MNTSPQMTLGDLIQWLAAVPHDTKVANLREAHSYRGYCTDLTFYLHAGTRRAGDLLAECQAALGKTFQGHKCGDYTMKADTPVWVAEYGFCSPRWMGLVPDASGASKDEL